jgi:Cu2+-exporting ATPase
MSDKHNQQKKTVDKSTQNEHAHHDSSGDKHKTNKDHDHQHDHKGDGHSHHGSHDHSGHHAMMIKDFRRRFWVSLIITLPILVLSPMIQDLLGYEFVLFKNADKYLLFGLSTIVYFYGGWPFLTGLADELKKKQPGMMTLIAVAITVAWGYSTATTFGLEGGSFFWELATLIDIMLLGHWIEMKSVMGASRSLQKLVELMPSEAHLLKNGDTKDVKIDELKKDDKVVVNC